VGITDSVLQHSWRNRGTLKSLARPARFELATYGFVVRSRRRARVTLHVASRCAARTSTRFDILWFTVTYAGFRSLTGTTWTGAYPHPLPRSYVLGPWLRENNRNERRGVYASRNFKRRWGSTVSTHVNFMGLKRT